MNNFNVSEWAEMSAKPCEKKAPKAQYMASKKQHELSEVETLVEAIESSQTDITSSYECWFKCAIALSSQFGERTV